MADSKLIPVAGIGIGSLFVYSALKNKSILSATQSAIQGKNPKFAQTNTAAPAPAGGEQGVTTAQNRTMAVSGPGETAWISAVMLSIGAPPTAANINSMSAWISHEGPWGTQGENGNNPLNTSITNAPGYEGKWPAAPIVSIFATATDGVAATAATLLTGYPEIVAAFRSGKGLCGNPNVSGELLTWSGNSYSEVC